MPARTPLRTPLGTPARTRAERGSAVPFAVACLGLLLVMGVGLGVAAALVADHRRAQAAADLAALAGAVDLTRGGEGCGAAGQVAAANGARLASCRVDGSDVRVRVVVTGPRWLGASADLAAEARAGPR